MIRIRHAKAVDATQIAAIHCASWRDAYSGVLDPAFLAGPIESDRLSVWADRLQHPDDRRIILVAEAADRTPIAFACAYRDLDFVWGSWIDNLHVQPQLRGNGVGRDLIRAIARSIATGAETAGLHLWVFEANEAALRFYRRLGGQVVERDHSRIPAAKGATILRVFWPDSSMLWN